MFLNFLYSLILLCQLILLVGTYVLDYFVKMKLGMNRWLMYHNMKIEKILPLTFLKIFIIAFVVVMTIIIIRNNFIKGILRLKKQNIPIIALVIISIAIIFYILVLNVKLSKTYYLNTLIFVLVYLLQLVKVKIVNSCE